MGSENKKLNISPEEPPASACSSACRARARPRTARSSPPYMKRQGKRPLLVACDVYRPAAIKQLETVGAQLGHTRLPAWARATPWR